jgi:hypothetical protein
VGGYKLHDPGFERRGGNEDGVLPSGRGGSGGRVGGDGRRRGFVGMSKGPVWTANEDVETEEAGHRRRWSAFEAWKKGVVPPLKGEGDGHGLNGADGEGIFELGTGAEESGIGIGALGLSYVDTGEGAEGREAGRGRRGLVVGRGRNFVVG